MMRLSTPVRSGKRLMNEEQELPFARLMSSQPQLRSAPHWYALE